MKDTGEQKNIPAQAHAIPDQFHVAVAGVFFVCYVIYINFSCLSHTKTILARCVGLFDLLHRFYLKIVSIQH
jgi:hypothetical protein